MGPDSCTAHKDQRQKTVSACSNVLECFLVYYLGLIPRCSAGNGVEIPLLLLMSVSRTVLLLLLYNAGLTGLIAPAGYQNSFKKCGKRT
jgi:hypothetical protein